MNIEVLTSDTAWNLPRLARQTTQKPTTPPESPRLVRLGGRARASGSRWFPRQPREPRCALPSLAPLARSSAYVVRRRRTSRPLSFPPGSWTGQAVPRGWTGQAVPRGWTGQAVPRGWTNRRSQSQQTATRLPSRFARPRLSALTRESLARFWLAASAA